MTATVLTNDPICPMLRTLGTNTDEIWGESYLRACEDFRAVNPYAGYGASYQVGDRVELIELLLNDFPVA